MAEKIEADYAELQRMDGVFRKSSDEVDASYNQIKNQVDVLRQTWTGRGADAFFQEMDRELMPALRKLSNAMEQGGSTTIAIANIVEQAEDDASGLFKKS